MRTGTAAVFLLGAALLAGCAPQQFETNWSRLRSGMSRQDVEQLLGKPSSTFTPQATAPDAPVGARATERWQYGDTLSSLGTRALFPEEADERTWCVFFGADGKVTRFERPYRGR